MFHSARTDSRMKRTIPIPPYSVWEHILSCVPSYSNRSHSRTASGSSPIPDRLPSPIGYSCESGLLSSGRSRMSVHRYSPTMPAYLPSGPSSDDLSLPNRYAVADRCRRTGSASAITESYSTPVPESSGYAPVPYA